MMGSVRAYFSLVAINSFLRRSYFNSLLNTEIFLDGQERPVEMTLADDTINLSTDIQGN
jgi:hypothetical protein